MTSKSVAQAFLALCESLDTSRSLACSLLFLNGEHSQLAQLDVKPSDYLEHTDLQKFRDDYLITEYLSKYKGLETGIDTEKVAFDSFTAAEAQCTETNERLHKCFSECGGETPIWILDVIARAQTKIHSCIGDGPSWRKMLGRFRWGPGATFSIPGREVRLDTKLLESKISVTAEALPFLRAAMSTDYAWLRARGLDCDGPTSLLDDSFKIVPGARALAVEKNAKTKRIINAEPSGNIFLQLGIGATFRQFLHRVGIDLDDQTINQSLAEYALDLGLATVDLKAASDTISSAIVWLLLPFSWASALDRLRSPLCRVKGAWLPLRKFSAMGNGYTFELETLIFWALTESLRDHLGAKGRISVYGDDIICPSEIVPHLLELFQFCGFTANAKKTHSTGVFRESCGKHFFAGADVTPIYQKEVPTDAAEIFRFYNRLVYHALDRGSICGTTGFADSKFRWVSALRSTTSGEVERFFARHFERRVKKLQQKLQQNESRNSLVRTVKLVPHDLLQVPIIANPVERTLDGGFLTDVRSLKFRYVSGWAPIRTLVWVFKPKQLEASQDAIYATKLRKPPTEVLPHRLERLMLQREVLGLRDQPLPFTGTVTARRQGHFVLRRAKFPEGCELRWI